MRFATYIDKICEHACSFAHHYAIMSHNQRTKARSNSIERRHNSICSSCVEVLTLSLILSVVHLFYFFVISAENSCTVVMKNSYMSSALSEHAFKAVSYTHLTLPTILLV